jgi:hypothetical protein
MVPHNIFVSETTSGKIKDGVRILTGGGSVPQVAAWAEELKYVEEMSRIISPNERVECKVRRQVVCRAHLS